MDQVEAALRDRPVVLVEVHAGSEVDVVGQGRRIVRHARMPVTDVDADHLSVGMAHLERIRLAHHIVRLEPEVRRDVTPLASIRTHLPVPYPRSRTRLGPDGKDARHSRSSRAIVYQAQLITSSRVCSACTQSQRLADYLPCDVLTSSIG